MQGLPRVGWPVIGGDRMDDGVQGTDHHGWDNSGVEELLCSGGWPEAGCPLASPTHEWERWAVADGAWAVPGGMLGDFLELLEPGS